MIISRKKKTQRLGLTLREVQECPIVHIVQDDSLADRAGLRQGDLVVAINGNRLMHPRYPHASSLLKISSKVIRLVVLPSSTVFGIADKETEKHHSKLQPCDENVRSTNASSAQHKKDNRSRKKTISLQQAETHPRDDHQSYGESLPPKPHRSLTSKFQVNTSLSRPQTIQVWNDSDIKGDKQSASTTQHRTSSNKRQEGFIHSEEDVFRTVTLQVPHHSELGFELQGGIEASSPIFIAHVEPGSLADQAGLQSGARIVDVNGIDFSSIPHADAVDIIRGSPLIRMILVLSTSFPVDSMKENFHNPQTFTSYQDGCVLAGSKEHRFHITKSDSAVLPRTCHSMSQVDSPLSEPPLTHSNPFQKEGLKRFQRNSSSEEFYNNSHTILTKQCSDMNAFRDSQETNNDSCCHEIPQKRSWGMFPQILRRRGDRSYVGVQMPVRRKPLLHEDVPHCINHGSEMFITSPRKSSWVKRPEVLHRSKIQTGSPQRTYSWYVAPPTSKNSLGSRLAPKCQLQENVQTDWPNKYIMPYQQEIRCQTEQLDIALDKIERDYIHDKGIRGNRRILHHNKVTECEQNNGANSYVHGPTSTGESCYHSVSKAQGQMLQSMLSLPEPPASAYLADEDLAFYISPRREGGRNLRSQCRMAHRPPQLMISPQKTLSPQKKLLDRYDCHEKRPITSFAMRCAQEEMMVSNDVPSQNNQYASCTAKQHKLQTIKIKNKTRKSSDCSNYQREDAIIASQHVKPTYCMAGAVEYCDSHDPPNNEEFFGFGDGIPAQEIVQQKQLKQRKCAEKAEENEEALSRKQQTDSWQAVIKEVAACQLSQSQTQAISSCSSGNVTNASIPKYNKSGQQQKGNVDCLSAAKTTTTKLGRQNKPHGPPVAPKPFKKRDIGHTKHRDCSKGDQALRVCQPENNRKIPSERQMEFDRRNVECLGSSVNNFKETRNPHYPKICQHYSDNNIQQVDDSFGHLPPPPSLTPIKLKSHVLLDDHIGFSTVDDDPVLPPPPPPPTGVKATADTTRASESNSKNPKHCTEKERRREKRKVQKKQRTGKKMTNNSCSKDTVDGDEPELPLPPPPPPPPPPPGPESSQLTGNLFSNTKCAVKNSTAECKSRHSSLFEELTEFNSHNLRIVPLKTEATYQHDPKSALMAEIKRFNRKSLSTQSNISVQSLGSTPSSRTIDTTSVHSSQLNISGILSPYSQRQQERPWSQPKNEFETALATALQRRFQACNSPSPQKVKLNNGLDDSWVEDKHSSPSN